MHVPVERAQLETETRVKKPRTTGGMGGGEKQRGTPVNTANSTTKSWPNVGMELSAMNRLLENPSRGSVDLEGVNWSSQDRFIMRGRMLERSEGGWWSKERKAMGLQGTNWMLTMCANLLPSFSLFLHVLFVVRSTRTRRWPDTVLYHGIPWQTVANRASSEESRSLMGSHGFSYENPTDIVFYAIDGFSHFISCILHFEVVNAF